jgi:hypothetical protein
MYKIALCTIRYGGAEQVSLDGRTIGEAPAPMERLSISPARI